MKKKLYVKVSCFQQILWILRKKISTNMSNRHASLFLNACVEGMGKGGDKPRVGQGMVDRSRAGFKINQNSSYLSFPTFIFHNLATFYIFIYSPSVKTKELTIIFLKEYDFIYIQMLTIFKFVYLPSYCRFLINSNQMGVLIFFNSSIYFLIFFSISSLSLFIFNCGVYNFQMLHKSRLHFFFLQRLQIVDKRI